MFCFVIILPFLSWGQKNNPFWESQAKRRHDRCFVYRDGISWIFLNGVDTWLLILSLIDRGAKNQLNNRKRYFLVSLGLSTNQLRFFLQGI